MSLSLTVQPWKFFDFFFKKIKILKLSQNAPEVASSNFVIYPLQQKSIVFEIFASQFHLQKYLEKFWVGVFKISLIFFENLIPGVEFYADSKYCHFLTSNIWKNVVTYIYIYMCWWRHLTFFLNQVKMALLVTIYYAHFNGLVGFKTVVHLWLVAPPLILACAKTLYNVKWDVFSECVWHVEREGVFRFWISFLVTKI